ncbi:MAG: ribbon-helix-helix domain-containing protein [Desulfobacteraceae bacterium]|jgi:metal-responsive CopG/Arc/MetJ family transcriptional regulator
METITVNIAFKDGLLKEIDKIAGEEQRTRSELLREAARAYIEKKNRWNAIFKFGDNQVSGLNLTQADISREIKKHRKLRRK